MTSGKYVNSFILTKPCSPWRRSIVGVSFRVIQVTFRKAVNDVRLFKSND
jgi:hypothetical protein